MEGESNKHELKWLQSHEQTKQKTLNTEREMEKKRKKIEKKKKVSEAKEAERRQRAELTKGSVEHQRA